MKNFKKIIICAHPKFTDLEAVERLAGIAKNSGAHITVMHVVSDYPEDVREWWNVRNPDKLKEKIVNERQGFLDEVAGRLIRLGAPSADTRLLWGKEFIEVTHEVLEKCYDLVVLTTRRKTPQSKRLKECPSREMLRHCPCTLWLTNGVMTGRFHRVLAAIKGNGAEVDCKGLDGKILATAAAVAESEGSELHVVHSLPSVGRPQRKGKPMPVDLAEYMAKLRKSIRDSCTEITGKALLKEENVHLPLGQPIDAIPALVREVEADLLVMGTATRPGLRAVLGGNPTEKMLDVIGCGMLVVKPDDFVSLVELEEELDGKLQRKCDTEETS
ncbi:MAG: universal stress protein [Gammaproteobacteria bacterium]|nr:universal stress protein [Gammaproteobacteria bacterium]